MPISDFDGAIRAQVRLRFGRLRADPEVFRLVQRVAVVRGVSRSALLGRSRGRDRDAAARQLAMYLAHILLGRSQDDVAFLFARDRTTVAHACQRLEDERGSRRLEAEIARIEAHLPMAIAAPEQKYAA